MRGNTMWKIDRIGDLEGKIRVEESQIDYHRDSMIEHGIKLKELKEELKKTEDERD